MVKESLCVSDKLLRVILDIQVSTSKETCLKLFIDDQCQVIDMRWIQKKDGSSYSSEMISIHISGKCEIKVGDKLIGRHENKCIISKILPRQNMCYLPYGRPNKWEDHVTIV